MGGNQLPKRTRSESYQRAPNWKAFSRIVEVMGFVDDLPELSSDEIRETASKLCDLPTDPDSTMSMEEVLFWSGVASGMDVCRQTQEEVLDQGSADKILLYASLLAHSTKNAIVDLALDELETSEQDPARVE
jgi:hypothetical protein